MSKRVLSLFSGIGLLDLGLAWGVVPGIVAEIGRAIIAAEASLT